MEKATKSEIAELRATRNKMAKFLEDAVTERAVLDKKIAGLKQVVASMNRILESEDDEFRLEPPPVPAEYEGLPKLGLTDAVRRILQVAGIPLGATEIRNRLSLYHYKKLMGNNPLAAIHGVLTRLLKAGEITPVAVENKKLYEWVDRSGGISSMYGLGPLGPGFDPRNLGAPVTMDLDKVRSGFRAAHAHYEGRHNKGDKKDSTK